MILFLSNPFICPSMFNVFVCLKRKLEGLPSKVISRGTPGWLSWLNIRLQLRSWSHSSWFQALLGSVLPGAHLEFCISPSLTAPPLPLLLLTLSLSLSKINKHFFKKILKSYFWMWDDLFPPFIVLFSTSHLMY